MILGTTPTHIFKTNIDVSLIDKVRIIYAQEKEVILVKETDSCTLDGNTITTSLTQEETFLFDSSKWVQIQVRVLLKDGNALASFIERRSPYELLENEVMA